MSLRDGLIAEYLFGGDARDTSGHGRHGVVHGATLVADRFGRPDSAFSFDGVDDYVEVTPPPTLNANALTVSIWARFDQRPLNGWANSLIAQDDGVDHNQERRVFQLSVFRGHIVSHQMVCARDPMCGYRVRFGSWHHIVATYGAGRHSLFVDGVLHDSVENTFRTHDTQPLHIGRKGTNEPFFFFRGALDDVRIYDRVLTTEEISALLREDGFKVSPASPRFPSGDPISGRWGQEGVLFLDLQFDGGRELTGRVMNGRPGVYAPIQSGTFDRESGTFRLAGNAVEHKTGVQQVFEIRGTLDGGEVTVNAKFGSWTDNLMFTRAGARWPWRYAVANGINRFVRRALGLRRHDG